MRQTRLSSDRGVALVMSIFALVVIGALVAGAFFVGRVEQVTGYNSTWMNQANEAAEAGLSHALMTVEAGDYQGIPVWNPSNPAEMALPTVTSGTIAFTDTIRRLNQTLFLIRSTGRRVSSGGVVLAEASVSQMMRLARPTIGINAAVTVQDPIKFNGNAFMVNGYNAYPPGWGSSDCNSGWPQDDNTDDVVGIRSSTETGAGKNDEDNIFGFPEKMVAHDPTITSETFKNFLDYTYATLTTQPGVKKLPATTPYNGIEPVANSDGACDKEVFLNFGEPLRPAVVPVCQGFFPVVHGTGAETKFAAGSRGQGILLIDGDLELVGGFEWVGLVIVRGQMKVTGTGNKIFGAILTEGVDLSTSGSVGGNVVVHYSKCGIDRAVQGATIPMPLSRGWSQAF